MRTKKSLPHDNDLLGADKALKRAAKKARELAVRTRTPLYIYEDGKIIDAAKRSKKSA